MTEPRRIRPPKRHEELINLLVDEEQGVFETKQAAMMFAAAVGFRFAGRKPLDSGGEGIRWNIFEKNRDDAFINALALADRKELSVLAPEVQQTDDAPTIFEEYAASGFDYLDQYLKDTPGDLLENLLALVQKYRSSQRGTPAGLEGLGTGALELLGDLEG